MNEHKVLGKTLKELLKINEQEKVKGFIGDVNEHKVNNGYANNSSKKSY
ncbi:hypothetical protein [Haloplasma contractile]|uniref:Uncharacterized protein n=1 Tax=Haloplasma contractile SSD-17B TaxID=1033810 RepID=U2EC22_9MOLU|nr:hypothetical protein [Haloplasma contractile]ERJ12341.1 hypothetical protein HLPCO_001327 [Haloplasma contractile SSD-17B]